MEARFSDLVIFAILIFPWVLMALGSLIGWWCL